MGDIYIHVVMFLISFTSSADNDEADDDFLGSFNTNAMSSSYEEQDDDDNVFFLRGGERLTLVPQQRRS
jgi:hypothetical protein